MCPPPSRKGSEEPLALQCGISIPPGSRNRGWGLTVQPAWASSGRPTAAWCRERLCSVAGRWAQVWEPGSQEPPMVEEPIEPGRA